MNKVYRPRTQWTPEMEAELLACDDRKAFAAQYGLSMCTVDGRYYKLKRRSPDARPAGASKAIKSLSGPRSRKAKL